MSDFVYQGEDFEERVRKQVEFYFSDSNLSTDKFLWKIYEANDGWVELKTLMTFGRMRQYRPEEKVIAALKASDKIVLSANDESIRRKDPLKDFNELKTTRKRNTEQGFNSIRRIRTRQDKKFFGVVDVEFKTSEDTEWFLKQVEVSYPEGVVSGAEEKESVEKKTLLKKMSLLTFQEMRESGKRFGVNDVTKRRNSFNDSRGKRRGGFKGGRRTERGDRSEKTEETSEEKSETAPVETTESKAAPSETSESKTEASAPAVAAPAESAPVAAAPAADAPATESSA
ncbi:hypothetical protein CAAN3_13S02696 [[Candida] anglica]